MSTEQTDNQPTPEQEPTPFEHPPIEMRGRNGIVRFGHAQVYRFTEGRGAVSFYSKRFGSMPPVAFYGDPDDLIALFESLATRLREALKS